MPTDAAAIEMLQAPAAAPPPPSEKTYGATINKRANAEARLRSNVGLISGVNTAKVVQRYAAGTVLQAGPGIPAWQYNSYAYCWSGPVESGDTVRFIYVGPVVLFFWRILGVISLGVLFVWLARAVVTASSGGRPA